MALSKVSVALGVMALISLGRQEVMADPVEVIVQTSIPANYGDTMVAVPVYMNNFSSYTIGGYRLTFNSSIPAMIDFVDTVDVAGSLSAGFETMLSTVNDDSLATVGDFIKVVGLADTSAYIMPQASGLLFTLFVNVSAACEIISDSNTATLFILPFISQVSDDLGDLIPSDSINLVNGSVEAPGVLPVLGDVNGSCVGVAGCQPTLGDVVSLVNYIFNKPGAQDPCQFEAADVNCSGNITLADVIEIVNYLFRGTPFSCP